MADDVRAVAGGQVLLPGFTLEPMGKGENPWWFRGTHDASGVAVFARRFERLSFADVLGDLSTAVGSLDTPHSQPGIATPLALVVTWQNSVAAGYAAASSGLTVTAAPDVAASIPADASVDAWAIYAASGDEALAAIPTDPRAACARLAQVAEVLDRLAEGHGAIDSQSLRITGDGALVLAFGFAPLEAARRNRLDATAPWLTVSPERCLPPGTPSAAGDQYALAAIWALGRTGSPPHDGLTADAIVRSKFTDAPKLESLAEDERRVLSRALAGAAESRFESSAAFAAALLDALVDGRPQDADGPLQPACDVEAEAAELSQPAAIPHQAAAADTKSDATDSTTPLPREATKPVAVGAEVTAHPLSDGVQQQFVIPAETRPVPNDPQPTDIPSVQLATAPYKPGDLILPGYRLERSLGKGGFGEVWKASAPGGMSVAIKVIGNLGRKEGAREFRALRTVKDVHHAHIVPIFGVWLKTSTGRLLDEDAASRAGERILSTRDRSTHGGNDDVGADSLESLDLVVAMGLGDQTLHDQMRSRSNDASEDGKPSGIEPQRLLEWMRQAALAIDFFNRGRTRQGTTSECVQHCDIKPQNMLLVGDAVQVCDFGLARVQGQARATANNLLSIAYAAPEMMVRPFNPSPSTDQYSLAVSYYELRTGRLPYGDPAAGGEEMAMVELMRAKTEGDITVSLVPPAEQRVIRRALALEPAERFASCAEFIDMLEAAIETDELPSTAPVRRPFPWIQSLAIVAGGILAVMLAIWLVPRRQNEAPQTHHLEVAQRTLLHCETSDGLDLEEISRAGKLAEEALTAGEDPHESQKLLDVAEAVLAVARQLEAVSADSRDLAPLESARLAVQHLPESVPATLRGALDRQWTKRANDIRKRTQTEAFEQLGVALRPDGSVDDTALREAATLANLLSQLDDEAGRRMNLAIEAIQDASKAVTASGGESGELDEAVRSLDRAGEALPPAAAQSIARRISARFVDRAINRLLNNELASSEASTSGKKRAIEDSLQDLDTAIKLDPQSWRAFSERGLCEFFLGRRSEAVGAYTKALDLVHESGGSEADRNGILKRRVFAHELMGDFGAAAADCMIFMADDPQLRATLWKLKDEAIKRQAYGDAANVLEQLDTLTTAKSMNSDEGGPTIKDVLGELAWLVACGYGRDPAVRALALAERLQALSGDEGSGDARDDLRRANCLDTLAAAYARAGQFDAAVRSSDDAIALLTSVIDRQRGNREIEKQLVQAELHRKAFAAGQTWNTY